MSEKTRLHYHSDCDFFAGCENMIANFLNSKNIYEHFNVTFSYRKTARYEEGIARRIQAKAPREFYSILSENVFLESFHGKSRLVRVFIKVLNYFLLVRLWVFIWDIFILYKAWRNKKIDILHINNGGFPGAISCLAAAIAARMCGIKIVVMVVNNIATASPWYGWQDVFINAAVKKSVSVFVTGSLNARKYLENLLHLPMEKLKTIHNGIASRELTETSAETRQRLNIPENVFAIGVVSLLEKRKGHKVLIEAVAKLKDLISKDQLPLFLIEGDGPEKAKLIMQVKDLNVTQEIRFIGVEKQVFNFINSLDMVVLPSVANEDFPNVILEGMSLGKPIISSRIAGTPEQVQEGTTGWLVEAGNAIALAERMASVIMNKENLIAIGSVAKQRFYNEFTAEVSVGHYIELYKLLLNGER